MLPKISYILTRSATHGESQMHKNKRELRVCSEFDNSVYSRYEALDELFLLLRGPQKLLNIPTDTILH
jgi:hypothetical protein